MFAGSSIEAPFHKTEVVGCKDLVPTSTPPSVTAATAVPAALFAQGGEDPLLIAADRCIEAYTALKAGDHADLRSLSELLLTSIGRTLARRLSS